MKYVSLQHVDFRWVWSKVLPQVYDDSLSYYEQLCKLGAALDTLATQCEEHFTEIYALIEIINNEIAMLKERMDNAEANIADLIEKTGILREDVDRLLQIAPDVEALEGKVAHLEGGNTGEVLAKSSNDDFAFQWKIVRGLPSYGSAEEGKILAVIYDGGSYEVAWIDPPTDIPEFYATDNGKVLKIELDGLGVPHMYWGLGLPELADAGADANKILGVNGDGDEIEWKVQEGTIPAYAYSDRGKALCVNASATGVEWQYRQDELPEFDLDKSFYVLSVNATGDGLFWQNNKVLGVEAFEGHGLPSSSIVAKTGDIYRDVDTNKLYWCVRYIDPVNITDLSYLGVVFNNTLDFSEVPFVQPDPAVNAVLEFSVSFKATGSTDDYIQFRLTKYGSYYRMDYLRRVSPTYFEAYNSVYIANPWVNPNMVGKILTDFSGNDCTNADLINFITSNGTITGAGSTWEEVSPHIIDYEYAQPLVAPSYRVTGDYKLSGTLASNGRATIYLTGATNGTSGKIFVENTSSHYVKIYMFVYMGNSNTYIFDMSPASSPSGEDWFIEPTPDNSGKLILNGGTTGLSYNLIASFDYIPE